jgi:hypothetical protein
MLTTLMDRENNAMLMLMVHDFDEKSGRTLKIQPHSGGMIPKLNATL